MAREHDILIRRGNDEDDMDLTEQFKIYSVPTHVRHTVFLGDNVGADSSEYIELLKFLTEVPGRDTVTIHLANFGGAVHTGFRIAHAIRACKAPVHIVVDAPCYSMGAILALTGRSLTLRPGTFLMFHNYSGMESGKGGEMLAAVTEFASHFHQALMHFCHPFLSKTEVKQLVRDHDVYVHAEAADLESRLKRHFK